MSDRVKYIIVEINGLETPVLFPNWVEHHHVAQAFGGKDRVLSAGFVDIEGDPEPLGKASEIFPSRHGLKVSCHGRSQTLGKESKDNDRIFIQNLLERHLTRF